MEVQLKKNIAAQIVVPAVTTASPETFDTGETLTDTAFYSDAGGAWTTLAITDTFTEISTTGVYVIDLTAAEMNHDLIMIKVTSANIADTAVIIRTTANDIDDVLDANDRVDVGSFLGQAVTLSAGNIPDVNAAEISDSSTAADNVEANIANLDAAITTRSDFDETADPVELLDTGGTAGTSASELVVDVWAAAARTITGHTAAALAEIEAECVDALESFDLDHLIQVTAGAEEPTIGSYLDQVMHKDGSQTFSQANDSLEAIRDRGDTSWITGAGGSPPSLLQNTTILVYTSQTSFTLTAGSTDDDAYNGCIIVITDQSTSTQKAVGIITDYTGVSRTVTLGEDPLAAFTFANGDTVDVIAAPKQLPDAVHGAAGGLATVDASNFVAGIQGAKNTFDDLNDIAQSAVLSDATPFAGANINATISSRSSHSAADVWAVGTRDITGGVVDTASVLVANNDKTGYSLAADQSAVTFGTCNVLVANNDKTGYTASTVGDKTGYSLAADQSAVTFGTCNVLVANNDKTGYTASTVSDKTGYSLAADQTSVQVGYVGTCTNLAPAALIDIFQEDITTHMSKDTQRVAEYIGVSKYAIANQRAVSAGGVETIYDDSDVAYSSGTYGTVGGTPYTPGNDEAAQRTRYKGG